MVDGSFQENNQEETVKHWYLVSCGTTGIVNKYMKTKKLRRPIKVNWDHPANKNSNEVKKIVPFCTMSFGAFDTLLSPLVCFKVLIFDCLKFRESPNHFPHINYKYIIEL